MKGSIKVKSMLLTVTKKLVLDGEPEVARRATTFPDHLVKILQDGTRWRAAVAVCSKAVAMESSSSSRRRRRRRVAWTWWWAVVTVCLSVLSLLDDGLEPSMEGSSLDVVWYGDRTG
jgi:hypothetical protein